MIPKSDKTIFESNKMKSPQHPCFNCGAIGYAKIHLPVAPKCNIKCKYCLEGCDCANEAGFGNKSHVLTPYEAVERFKKVRKRIDKIKVAGISGPGESLENFDEVRETFRLIRMVDSKIVLCVSTNGLMLPIYASHLISLGVTHVSVTVNAVNPKTGCKIYEHITYLGNVYQGEEGANILIQNQMAGMSFLSSMGVVVKLNCMVFWGINEKEITDICLMAKECGIDSVNLIPIKDQCGVGNQLFNMADFFSMRNECENIIHQITHSRPCDAQSISLGRYNIQINEDD